ncbi:hypothetical protein Y032_0012g1907 [Ancylostoma ceylanicum]|uniref:Uncharacterized protein n=1 Tax=Ancylostoma ceylanicum TaxID=53326 RepID=A0A016VDW7_9BILA|nr:hypothetical protein Y032_0012g1907 [Ancylostoma ceylanicum]
MFANGPDQQFYQAPAPPPPPQQQSAPSQQQHQSVIVRQPDLPDEPDEASYASASYYGLASPAVVPNAYPTYPIPFLFGDWNQLGMVGFCVATFAFHEFSIHLLCCPREFNYGWLDIVALGSTTLTLASLIPRQLVDNYSSRNNCDSTCHILGISQFSLSTDQIFSPVAPSNFLLVRPRFQSDLVCTIVSSGMQFLRSNDTPY